MEMKPSLSTSANQMQDLHAEHHHHQSNLTLTQPGYKKKKKKEAPRVLMALIKTVANVTLQPPEGGGCRRGSSSRFPCLF